MCADRQICLNTRRGGGIAMRIVLIVISIAVIAGVVAGLLNILQKNQERDSRKAVEISDCGLMSVMERLGTRPSMVSDIPETPCENGWYSARFIRNVNLDTVYLSVEVTGHAGNISKKQTYNLRLSVVDGDSSWVRTETR
jgi:hypothetical protein